VLKSVLGEKAENVMKEISKTDKLFDFLEEAKENPKELEKITGKKDAKKILDILKIQKQKKYIIKKEILLTTINPNGLELIKKILGKIKDVEIKYLSAGRYTFKAESKNPKTADNKLKEIIKDIEQQAKKQGLEFSTKEK